jgi:hypothetical protein
MGAVPHDSTLGLGFRDYGLGLPNCVMESDDETESVRHTSSHLYMAYAHDI